MKNRLLAIVFIALLIFSGCGPKAGSTPPPLRIGMVVDTGGLKDYSFNESANRGLVMAMQDLNCDVKILESRTEADYEENIRSLARSGYDLVIVVGVLFSDPLKKVAAEFPGIKFASIDGDVTDAPNVATYQFREEEGSFLAGVLAARVSKSKKIGFVGGMNIPLIEKFEAGYKAGASGSYPKIQVLTGLTESFSDPDGAREIAHQMMRQGVDVIYHAAGGSGAGVIDAVHDRGVGFYAIGVDSDQDHMATGRVLTSVIKRIDTAVYDSIKAVKEGRFKGGLTVLGIREGGISLSPMTYTKDFIVALDGRIMKRLSDVSRMIREGTIVVPDTREKLNGFKAPTEIEWR